MKKIKLSIIILAVILLVAAIVALLRLNRNNHLSFGTDSEIDVTPTQIVSIKAIGEWEFLSVSLGIDMRQVTPGWITTNGDSVVVVLPKVGLLDKAFIDEARTKSFYESGKWSAADREALYKKAYRLMKAHCLTQENLQAAEANGHEQFTRMMQSMGYKNVKVTFEK